jgi:hypothetical protein
VNANEQVQSLELKLESMRQILASKRHDYAEDDDILANFRISGWLMEMGKQAGLCGEDLTFLDKLGTKLARMIALRGGDKIPNNESITDTLVDMANYCLLWATFIEERQVDDLPF